MIKQIFHPWHKWECIEMYLSEIEISTEYAKKSYAEFLSNKKLFQKSILRVFNEWPISCEHFLTNESINRIAWIGQASMFIETGIPAKYRGGFFLLSEKMQFKANEKARINLNEWLLRYNKQKGLFS